MPNFIAKKIKPLNFPFRLGETEFLSLKAGQKVALNDIDRNTSFHLDHGNGMDAYGVGIDSLSVGM